MKLQKKLLPAAIAATLAAASFAPAASAELEWAASADIASMYLWRGQNLGNGDAMFAGDLSASYAGAYAGVWVASGDSAGGTEYDWYAGYGTTVGDVGVDFMLTNYNYAQDGQADSFELSDATITLSWMGAELSYTKNITGDGDFDQWMDEYWTIGASLGKFSILTGLAYYDGPNSDDDYDYSHIDVTYAINDNFSLTLSQGFVSDEAFKKVDEDLNLVFAYSLPIEL